MMPNTEESLNRRLEEIAKLLVEGYQYASQHRFQCYLKLVARVKVGKIPEFIEATVVMVRETFDLWFEKKKENSEIFNGNGRREEFPPGPSYWNRPLVWMR